jgi:hypothetical protein
MARYITTDTLNGEIVHSSNRHPSLQPLTCKPRGRVSRSTGFQSKSRPDSQLKHDLYVLALGAFLGLLLIGF